MSWKLSIAYIIIKLFGYSIQDSTPKILMDHMTHDVTLSLSTTEVNACDLNTYIPIAWTDQRGLLDDKENITG